MSLHIVMTGEDSTAFTYGSETHTRFLSYARILREIFPDSQLSYIGLTSKKNETLQDQHGINLYPISSLAMLPHAIFKLHKKSPISVLTTQTTYVECWIAYSLSFFLGFNVIPQEHNDPFSRIDDGTSKLKRVLKFIRQYIAMRLLKFAKAVRAVSPEVASNLRRHLPKEKEIAIIPVPITIQPRPRLDRKLKPLLLYVGRLAPQKNVETFLNVAAEMKKMVPELEVHVVGDGQLREELERIAPQETIFHGWLSQDNLSKLYSQASVLIAPSWYEGFGRVLVEAMACGVPVISSTTSGPSYIIGMDQAGYLTAPDDIPLMIKHTLNLLTNPLLAEEMRQRGYKTAEKFKPELLQKEWINFLYKFR